MRRTPVAGFALLVAIAIALSLAASLLEVLPLDRRLAWELQKETNPAFNLLMQGVSEPGRPIVAAGLILVAALTFAVLRSWREGILVLASATGIAFGWLVKVLVARARPTPGLLPAGGWLAIIDQYSFPSGHVVFYVVFFGTVAYLSWTRFSGWLSRAVAALCALLIVLVGPSRVFLGAHWASDVAGGYLIGGLWLVILIIVWRLAAGKDRLRGE